MIVRLLLAGIVGVADYNRTYDLAYTLRSILMACNDQGLGWLASALALLPDISASAGDKQEFLGEGSQT